MPILRGDLLDHLACLLGPVRLAEQSDEEVESVAVAVLCAVVEHGFHTAVAKRSVEPPTCMDVRAGQVRELCEPFRVGEQGHVPQMVAVSVVVGGTALGVGAHQGDGGVPVTGLLCCPCLLEPCHRSSIAQPC